MSASSSSLITFLRFLGVEEEGLEMRLFLTAGDEETVDVLVPAATTDLLLDFRKADLQDKASFFGVLFGVAVVLLLLLLFLFVFFCFGVLLSSKRSPRSTSSLSTMASILIVRKRCWMVS